MSRHRPGFTDSAKDMLHASTRKLIDRLYQLTMSRQMHWDRNAAGNGVYRGDGYEVELCPDPCRLRILDVAGNELENNGADALAACLDEDACPYDRIVREMAIDALRIASGVERAIEVVLRSLEGASDGKHSTMSSETRIVRLSDEGRRRGIQLSGEDESLQP